MKETRAIYLFFGVLFLISIVGFAALNIIDRNNPHLPYMGNKKVATSKTEAVDLKIPAIGNFNFINQNNKNVTDSFVKGKVWIANFFFSRCGTVCPIMSSNLSVIQSQFLNNKNFRIVSFSCDPENDQPKELLEYAQRNHADINQWQFATGDKIALYRFARNNLQLTATNGDGGVNDFIHSQNLVLIDKEGFIRGYYDGTNEDQIQQLIKDIHKLI